MTAEIPIACSLDAGDYRARLRSIRELGATALRSAEERPDGAILRFRRGPGIGRELAAIVEAENACCPFLGLDIREDEEALVLSITSPPDAMPVARDLVESFRGRRQIAATR